MNTIFICFYIFTAITSVYSFSLAIYYAWNAYKLDLRETKKQKLALEGQFFEEEILFDGYDSFTLKQKARHAMSGVYIVLAIAFIVYKLKDFIISSLNF